MGRGTLGDFVKEAQKGRAREDSTSKSAKTASVVHDAVAEEVRVVLAAGIVAARRDGIQHDRMVKLKLRQVVVFIVLAAAVDNLEGKQDFTDYGCGLSMVFRYSSLCSHTVLVDSLHPS